MMTILALVYEVTYTSLKLQRDRERTRYLQLAATDPLTGLANRRMFDETLAARIELYSKLNPVRPFALCYLDLDRFKPINDQFGHNIGDEVLSSISDRLHQMLRGADYIGRHGGDEFLILLDSVQNAASAEAMSKRFLQRIEEPIDTSAGIMSVSSSFGFALFPDHGADAATLQRAADEAMYAAKRGRYGFQIYGQPT
jgi:diguanylate cyclase (GGDEF)-like protein